MTFPAYPAYRESGNPWIGSLPVGWEVIALKRDLHFLTSGSRGWADHYADEGALFLRIGNLPRDGLELDLADIQRVAVPAGAEGERTRVEPGDVLFSITAFMGSVAVVPDNLECAYVSQHVALARLRGDLLLPRWVGYATLSAAGKAYLDAQCYGGTKIQLSLDDVANLPVSVPPVAEQRALIAFLDRETGKIDALVAEQERLIALLKEKRQAVISHAVTKGLNPAAPMKDSGVEWLGQIPAHWEVRSFGSCVMIAEGQVDPRGEPFASMVLIAPNHIESGTGRLLELESAAEQGAESGKYQFEAGAVLYSKIRPALAKVAVAPQAGLCSADMYPLTPREVLSPAYLARLMLSPGFTAWAVLESDRVAMPKINREKLSALRLPVPPIHEQAEILSEVDRKCTQIDALVDQAELAIGLFAERRAALISAAVTGKIDVRGLAPVIETKPAAWVRDQVGAEIISLQAHKPKFGRVKFQKQIFLAETHVGVSEIGGRYQREAAGPYDRALIASVEKNLEDAGFMTVKQAAKGAAVTYHLKSGVKPNRDGLKAALGDRAEALAAMIKLTADLDTAEIEAVATLYAAWNDLLIDGQPAPDDRIITSVLSEWHPEKAEKFNRDGLQSWLDWMRRHNLVPRGEGPKTQLGSLL